MKVFGLLDFTREVPGWENYHSSANAGWIFEKGKIIQRDQECEKNLERYSQIVRLSLIQAAGNSDWISGSIYNLLCASYFPSFLEQCLEQLPYASPMAVCWVFMHRVCTLFISVHRAAHQEDFIIKNLLPWNPDSGISSAPVCLTDDETLDFGLSLVLLFVARDLEHGLWNGNNLWSSLGCGDF